MGLQPTTVSRQPVATCKVVMAYLLKALKAASRMGWFFMKVTERFFWRILDIC